MREQSETLAERNLRVLVVSFESGAAARRYQEETGLPWPLLVDAERTLYRAYGMQAAGFFDIWGPASWRAYSREIMAGRLPKKPSGDIMQRGGDVLIDPQGIVRFHHVGAGPADRPPVADILKQIG